jgi:hypothetical protein
MLNAGKENRCHKERDDGTFKVANTHAKELIAQMLKKKIMIISIVPLT